MQTSTRSPERIGVHTIKPEVLSHIAPLPEATAAKLPRWRGFNLLNRFILGWSNTPFLEQDFELISRWGFNFARLPVDYRIYTDPENWLQIKPDVIEDFDRAIEFGARYGVHINLCLHRIPGYTVSTEKERTSIFTDSATLEVSCRHWVMFARRWAGIPNRLLSFDLFNEPAGADGSVYAKVVRALVSAIRKEDPDRLIMADGLDYATKPVPELVPLKIAQAMHNYQPFGLTHYKTSWVTGASEFPEPQWPSVQVNNYLYGNAKPEIQHPLECDISRLSSSAGEVGIHVNCISSEAEIVMTADGKEIYRHRIICTAGEGEWTKAVRVPEWNSYQNEFDRSYTARYPKGTKTLTIRVERGDWLRFSELMVAPDGKPALHFPTFSTWGLPPGKLVLGSDRSMRNTQLPYGGVQNKAWLTRSVLKPWTDFHNKSGVGVFIGEWGVFSAVPHNLTLRFMEDSLRAFKQANMGWALWNLRGDFGIINSNRKDVQYEQMGSDKLDRKMLELLKRY